MATSRRFIGPNPTLTRRAWESVAQELQEFLRKLRQAWDDGIPPGYNGIPPVDVEAGKSPSPGTEGLGWAAADHYHDASTATPISLDPDAVNSEGIESTLARSDHSHDASALSDDAFIWSIVFGGK